MPQCKNWGTEEAAEQCLPLSARPVGIDVELKAIAYISNGEEITDSHIFRSEETTPARAPRKLVSTLLLNI